MLSLFLALALLLAPSETSSTNLAQRTETYASFLKLRHDSTLAPAEVFFASDQTVIVRFSDDTSGPTARAIEHRETKAHLWLLFVQLSDNSISEMAFDTYDGLARIAAFPDGTVILVSKDELIRLDHSGRILQRMPIADLCGPSQPEPNSIVLTDLYPAGEDLALAVRAVNRIEARTDRIPELKTARVTDVRYCWFRKSDFGLVAQASADTYDRHTTSAQGLA